MRNIAIIGIIVLSLPNSLWAQETNYQAACIAFYNVENLFDTIQDPKVRDEEFLPEGGRKWDRKKYQQKLDNLAKVIDQIGRNVGVDGPAILGVCEVENRRVLEDLCRTDALKAKNYQIVHEDSPDARGIDVALLYRPTVFKVLAHRMHRVPMPERATRDLLVVTGLFEEDTLSVIVNHWPSRSGGEQRSAPRRIQAAEVARSISDSLKQRNPKAKIILMGDFNDDPNNDSIKKTLGAKGKLSQVKAGDLFNPMFEMHRRGLGSLAYRDTWQIFDQLILSSALLEKSESGYFYLANSAKVFSPTWLKQSKGRFGGYPFRTFAGGSYAGGFSDHFPVYLFLVKKL